MLIREDRASSGLRFLLAGMSSGVNSRVITWKWKVSTKPSSLTTESLLLQLMEPRAPRVKAEAAEKESWSPDTKCPGNSGQGAGQVRGRASGRQ